MEDGEGEQLDESRRIGFSRLRVYRGGVPLGVAMSGCQREEGRGDLYSTGGKKDVSSLGREKMGMYVVGSVGVVGVDGPD